MGTIPETASAEELILIPGPVRCIEWKLIFDEFQCRKCFSRPATSHNEYSNLALPVVEWFFGCTMEKRISRKCVSAAMVLAITLATGCSQMRIGWPPDDTSEEAQSTSAAHQRGDVQTKDGEEPGDIEEQDQSTTMADPQSDPQTEAEQQAADAEAQNQSASTPNHRADARTEDAEPPEDIVERSQSTPIADPQASPRADAGQPPADAAEQSPQSTPRADLQTNPQTDAGQQATDALEQSETTFMADLEADPQLEAEQQPTDAAEQSPQSTPRADLQTPPQGMIGSPMWVTGPSPYEIAANERSYLIVGLNLGESAEIIPASSPNPFQAFSITRFYGILDLVKKIRRFNTGVNYKGGAYFFGESGSPGSVRDVEQLTFTEGISWPRTQLSLQDSPSYFPGASFGSYAFGGASGYSLGLGGTSTTNDFFGFNDFYGIGGVEHFTNVALAQISHALTARSSVVIAGADAITDYFGGGSINSQQISGLAGYSYAASARTQISGFYGYQELKFIGGATADANTVQLNYGRSLSPRITFSLGAGPQFITSHTPELVTIGPVQIPVVVPSHQTGFSAVASLGYGLRFGSLGLNYEHLLTSGSGLFAGATSDILSASMTSRIWRAWVTNFSAGFARLSNNISNQSSGILGNSYQYWFAGFGFQHRLGRHLNLIASYQFDDNTVTSACSPSSGCGSNVHTALISVTWRALPINLDRWKARDRETEGTPVNLQNSPGTLP